MIEVLESGEVTKTSPIVITKCPKCGCLFRFNADEDVYHERIWCEDRIDCPECGEEITVRNTSCWVDDPDAIVCPRYNENGERIW